MTISTRLHEFAVAEVDKELVCAIAAMGSPDAITVWSEEVKRPGAIRYGWDENPEVSLYSRSSLPASPFRTDTPLAHWQRNLIMMYHTMRRSLPLPLLALCGWLLVGADTGAAEPVKIIVDTDMMTDCDDAGAFAVLHGLADRGECEILATMVSSKSDDAVLAVSVINTYYGRPEIPVGAVKGSGVTIESHYTGQLARDFPHALKTATDAQDAVQLYRQILEAQPDHSVVIATVGYLTNIKRLLELPADGVHAAGLDLVKRKVKLWVCMGGNFIGNPPHDDLKLGNVNFQRDALAAKYAVDHWPVQITFVGREVASVPSGVEIGASLAAMPADNPVRAAYYAYFGGAFKNRHVADLATVFCAVRGPDELWDLSPPGRMLLRPDMTFDWQADSANGNQRYLLKRKADGKPNDKQVESILDALLTARPKNHAPATPK